MEWLKKLVKYKDEEKTIFYMALAMGIFPAIIYLINGLRYISEGTLLKAQTPLGRTAELIGMGVGVCLGSLVLFLIWFYLFRWIRNFNIKREKQRKERAV